MASCKCATPCDKLRARAVVASRPAGAVSIAVMDAKHEYPNRHRPEPRWPALVAVLAVGGLYLALPASLTIGPRWLLPGLLGGLLIPTVVSHAAGHHDWDRRFGF